MRDTRCTATANDVEALLATVDVDGLGDVETLLTLLFARPLSVEEGRTDQGEAPAVEVFVAGDAGYIGTTCEFPLSLLTLARACADTVTELGPSSRDGFTADAAPLDVSDLSDEELVAVLQSMLGQVRVFNSMDESD